MWLLHDDDDESVGIAQGRSVRDRFLAMNECSATTTTADPAVCVVYEGCAPDRTIEWCVTEGAGHDIRGDFAPALVWRFFATRSWYSASLR